MALRLFIADDHPMLVDGLRTVLEEMDDVLVVGTAANGRHLLDQLLTRAADMVLLDLNMPRLDGLVTLPLLKKQFPLLKVIVFTSYNQPTLIRELSELGADGFLLKNSDSITLKQAVTAVAAGRRWFPIPQPMPETPPVLVDEFMRKFQLTRREVEIIRLIAAGLTTRQISEQLFISDFTTNAHRRNITRKLAIDTPVGLLNFARDQGLIA